MRRLDGQSGTRNLHLHWRIAQKEYEDLGRSDGDGDERDFQNSGVNKDDDYRYPSLYEEAVDMLNASILVYTLTLLRSEARKPDTWVSDPRVFLSLPLSLSDCVQAIGRNRKAIQTKLDMEVLGSLFEKHNHSSAGRMAKTGWMIDEQQQLRVGL